MRREIRAAAIRVIKRKNLAPGDVRGYQQVTIRDVIEEANISIGTFYKYFKNREELAQALWAPPVDRLRAAMQSDFEEADDPEEKVRVLLEHYVKFSMENREVFRGIFLFVRPDNYPMPEPLELRDEVFYKNLRLAFDEGQSQRVFRAFDTHSMAQVFWAAIHGSLALPANLDRYNFDDPATLSGNMIDALLQLIGH